MRFNELSTLCATRFIEDAALNTPLSLAITYRGCDLSQISEIARYVPVVVGLNLGKPIGIDDVSDVNKPIGSAVERSDYLRLIGHCMAFYNAGHSLNTMGEYFDKNPMAYREKAKYKDRSILNPITMQYFWFLSSRYFGQGSLAARKQPGGLDTTIDKFFTEHRCHAGNITAGQIIQLMRHIEKTGNLTPCHDDALLYKQGLECPLLQRFFKPT